MISGKKAQALFEGWLQAVILTAFWGMVNVQVGGTPVWLDLIFSIVSVYFISRKTYLLTSSARARPALRAIAGAMLLFLLIILLSYLGYFLSASINIPGFVLVPGTVINRLAMGEFEAFGNLSPGFELVLGWFILGTGMLLAAFAVDVIWLVTPFSEKFPKEVLDGAFNDLTALTRRDIQDAWSAWPVWQRRRFLRSLAYALWISAFFAVWVLFNIYFASTPVWLDAAGIVLVFVLGFLAVEPWSASLIRSTKARRLGWGIWILLLTSLVWSWSFALQQGMDQPFRHALLILFQGLYHLAAYPILDLQGRDFFNWVDWIWGLLIWTGSAELILVISLSLRILIDPLVRILTPSSADNLARFMTMLWRNRRAMRMIKRFGTALTLFLVVAGTAFFLLAASERVASMADFDQTLPLPQRSSVAPVFFAAGPGTGIFMTTGTQVYQKDEAGDVWRVVLPEQPGIPYILSLAYSTQNETLYAGTQNGVYRLAQNGNVWQFTGLRGSTVNTLAVSGPKGYLYAGTMNGLFRAALDRDKNWSTLAPRDTAIFSLLVDSDGGLFAGTRQGVYSNLEQVVFKPLGSLELPVYSMALDPAVDTLYAGTSDGVHMTRTAEVDWAGVELEGQVVHALQMQGRNGQASILYAGTTQGIYRSVRDTTGDWEEMPGSGASKLLALDSTTLLSVSGGEFLETQTNDGRLFSWTRPRVDAGGSPARGGLTFLAYDQFRNRVYAGLSDNAGSSQTLVWYDLSDMASGSNLWQEVQGLPADTRVQAVEVDPSGRYVHLLLDGNLVRWDPAGGTFERSPEVFQINALAMSPTGVLFAGTADGVFSSDNSGRTWRPMGLAGLKVRGLFIDSTGRQLYASAGDDLYRYRVAEGSWSYFLSLKDLSGNPMRTLPLLENSCGQLQRSVDGELFWAGCRADLLSGGLSFSPDELFLNQNPISNWTFSIGAYPRLPFAYAYPGPGGVCLLFQNSGNILRIGSADRNACTSMNAWRGLLTWTRLSLIPGMSTLAGRIGSNLMLLITVWTVWGLYRYVSISRGHGIPFWVTFLVFRPGLLRYADPGLLGNAVSQAAGEIEALLVREGRVDPGDLADVPRLFRHAVLRSFYENQKGRLMIDYVDGSLFLQAGNRLSQWRLAWDQAGMQIGQKPGLTPAGLAAVEELMGILADSLGLTIISQRTSESCAGFLVEAPALRTRLPLAFPFLFIADPDPDAQSVQRLVDIFDIVKGRSYDAFVVPLQPAGPAAVNTALGLHQAIEHTVKTYKFMVLGGGDIIEILVSRNRAQTLVRKLLDQSSISEISPFVINGPVPETMFFGREEEIRNLVENCLKSDFAVVGNRKVGKTSLIKRVEAKLSSSGTARPLWIDCQAVRTSRSFFTSFEVQTGIPLASRSNNGFSKAIGAFSHEGPMPVLIMDEVDALLAGERETGEKLTATFRSLSQAGICHFIFCGSTRLAKLTRDAGSSVYNFPDLVPLTYLKESIVQQVLLQPFRLMGVWLADQDALLGEVFSLTSGHPNLVQMVGKNLVDRVNTRQERVIQYQDILDLSGDKKFLTDLVTTIWGEAGPLEKIITLQADAQGFNLATLRSRLSAMKINVREDHLEEALWMLQIYSILEEGRDGYRFIPARFPELLRSLFDVDRAARKLHQTLSEKKAAK